MMAERKLKAVDMFCGAGYGQESTGLIECDEPGGCHLQAHLTTQPDKEVAMAISHSSAHLHACKFCGKQFRSYNPSPKFCSRDCRGKAERADVDESRVYELYASGATLDEVAAALGITRKLVTNVLVRNSVPRRKAVPRNQRGSNNGAWKGDTATYNALHRRVEAVHGTPKHCEVCGTEDASKQYDWANLTGNYTDVNDFKRMCKACHAKFDRWHTHFNSKGVGK